MTATKARKLFVNLAVNDLPRTKAFFSKLGFGYDPQFTNDEAACMPISEDAFVMLLRRDRFKDFEKAVSDIPEVLECLLITGQAADYQLKVVVRDMDAYQELLLNRITRIPGVTGVHSSFVLRRVIERQALPLGDA